MAAIRKVEDLSTDPNFVGYYDIEEAHKQDIDDISEITSLTKEEIESIKY